jgi:hypothetical protein
MCGVLPRPDQRLLNDVLCPLTVVVGQAQDLREQHPLELPVEQGEQFLVLMGLCDLALINHEAYDLPRNRRRLASGGRPSDSVAEYGIYRIVQPEREILSGT